MLDWHNGLHMLIGLVVIVNPLLAVTAYAALTDGEDLLQRRATAQRAALTVALVLSASALGGESLLKLFDISLPAFKVGGGILILLMAIAMLHARQSGARHTEQEADEAQGKAQVGVVPLGIPLLAGPGAISTVIIYSHSGLGWMHQALLLAEIWFIGGLVWLALHLGEDLTRVLGTTGLNIASRVMGLLLAAIAVGFVTDGLKVLLPGLA
jgi:multiple antibiotic resistance protein